MGLECKQVTLTSTLEFSLFYQGCPLKESAGYKIGKLEELENSLQCYLNLKETEQLPDSCVCLDSRLTSFSEVFPFPTSCSVKKYIFLSPVEIPQLVKNQWIIYGTLINKKNAVSALQVQI